MPGQSWTEAVQSTIADGTQIVSSTAEALVFPVYPQPASAYKQEKVFEGVYSGRISNVVTTPGNLTLRLRFGGLAGTIVCQSATAAIHTTAHTNEVFIVRFYLVVRNGGVSGSVFCTGVAHMPNMSTSGYGELLMGSAGLATPAAVSYDLSVDFTIAFTAQFSVSNASNNITGHTAYWKSLN